MRPPVLMASRTLPSSVKVVCMARIPSSRAQLGKFGPRCIPLARRVCRNSLSGEPGEIGPSHPTASPHPLRLPVKGCADWTRWLTGLPSGIGLETSILFANEGANVMMADISAPALEKAVAKVRQLVPGAKRVDTMVCWRPMRAAARRCPVFSSSS
jgi:hypothetical protein